MEDDVSQEMFDVKIERLKACFYDMPADCIIWEEQ